MQRPGESSWPVGVGRGSDRGPESGQDPLWRHTDHFACHSLRKVLGLSFPHLYPQPPPCRSTTLSGMPLRSVVNHQPLALVADTVYSKVSDDSDIEGHPNVDHKSLVRYSLPSTSHLIPPSLKSPSRPSQMETTPNSRRSGGEETQNRYPPS